MHRTPTPMPVPRRCSPSAARTSPPAAPTPQTSFPGGRHRPVPAPTRRRDPRRRTAGARPATGVQRVVALSAINVDDDLDEQPSRYRGDRNKEVEDAAVASGLEWVSLRAGFFAIDTLHAW